MDTNKLPSVELFKNVFLKSLARDEGRNFQVDLVEVGPNTALPEHTHDDLEWLFILEGSISDENGVYHKDDFLLLPKGSRHLPRGGAEGCKFLRYWCGTITLV